jgi:hypothetical protein
MCDPAVVAHETILREPAVASDETIREPAVASDERSPREPAIALDDTALLSPAVASGEATLREPPVASDETILRNLATGYIDPQARQIERANPNDDERIIAAARLVAQRFAARARAVKKLPKRLLQEQVALESAIRRLIDHRTVDGRLFLEAAPQICEPVDGEKAPLTPLHRVVAHLLIDRWFLTRWVDHGLQQYSRRSSTGAES